MKRWLNKGAIHPGSAPPPPQSSCAGNYHLLPQIQGEASSLLECLFHIYKIRCFYLSRVLYVRNPKIVHWRRIMLHLLSHLYLQSLNSEPLEFLPLTWRACSKPSVNVYPTFKARMKCHLFNLLLTPIFSSPPQATLFDASPISKTESIRLKANLSQDRHRACFQASLRRD